MIYRGSGSERHGDEIMVLQENIIVFKGFLRAKGFDENLFFFLSIIFMFDFKNHLHLNLNNILVD
jgi:hypothetical protein